MKFTIIEIIIKTSSSSFSLLFLEPPKFDNKDIMFIKLWHIGKINIYAEVRQIDPK
jgi:hypothetical protein